ncbi:lipoyltransferase 1, mitochondrial-like [Asterias rubens]|uniref:lipoyltransferase 1, mitochondrial-like n=1 Tax=Asterias rubens TaxID=7604 RepID=UPI0014555E04|nr:lipoyltransferase 1, mitochondrial-like [Asterias rubens]
MYSPKFSTASCRIAYCLFIRKSKLNPNKNGTPWICSRKYCKAAQQRGVVYESVSHDVFSNLAFEDWVYHKLDLSETNLLLLWRNDSSVVIGRHQNPWAECQLRHLWGSKVSLARRRSGGGTVYHDLGNLNCTFFTKRSEYSRIHNLELLTSALKTRWPMLNIGLSKRDDILLDDFFKISGSSAKLGREIAYHHCTLLHSVNTQQLKSLLHSQKDGLTSRATASVRTAVKNLSDMEPTMDHESLVDAIAQTFYTVYPPLHDDKIYPIDPSSELDWPQVNYYRKDLASWDWVYGKTPEFSVQRSNGDVSVLVHVKHAHILGVVVQAPDRWIDVGHIQSLTDQLAGKMFWPHDVIATTNSFLQSINIDQNTRQRMNLVCSLLQEAIS